MALLASTAVALSLLAPADAEEAAARRRDAAGAQSFAAGGVPPARFTDPRRREKLAAAFPEIDRIFREWTEKQPVPGLAYGIVIDGELAHANAFGVRDVTAQAPATVDSVFRIASMTKSFTALAILKLRDEGRLALDDPAARYVPELARLRYPTRDAPLVTIRHLLSHQAGFPEDNPWGDRQLGVADATMSAWMKAGIPFSNAPGAAFEYSNYGFAILGRIVARASGTPYRAYLERHVLKPLGMSSTYWEEASVPVGRVAKGHARDGERWIAEEPLPDGAFGAMGGLYSSVPDLARYVALYLSAYPPRDEAEAGPVRRATLRQMQAPESPYRARAFRESADGPLLLSAGGYGFGLGVAQTCRFGHSVSHGGGLPGFGSQMRWLPEHGVGLVALANRTYAGPGRPVADALEALARTGALAPRLPQPAPALLDAQAAVNRLYAQWSDDGLRRVAADNLLLDRALDTRRKQFAELRAKHGECRSDGEAGAIDAENALRGDWRLACERGQLRFSVTLAPTAPPAIQHLEATSILLDPRLQPLAAALAARIANGAAAPAKDLLAPGADSESVGRAVVAAGAYGPCRVGPVRSGGGEGGTVRFECDRGALDVELGLDVASGKLRTARLAPAAGESCVP